MREVLQVRYGEIFLKGLNRPTFLRMLVDRVRDAVKAVGGHVWLSDGRIYVSDAADMDETIRRDQGVRRAQRVPRHRDGKG